MKIKAVIFDVGGVILPQPQRSIAAYGKNINLPTHFLPELFMKGSPNNSFCKLERGELTLQEFYGKFESEAAEKARKESVVLPACFSAKALFKSIRIGSAAGTAEGRVNAVNIGILDAVTQLRKAGILTCVLTNNWIVDDDDEKESKAKFMKLMKSYFNEVIESIHVGIRKPEIKIYEYACQLLRVHPVECAFLDDIGQNLKSAKQLGITCIKVDDTTKALRELEVVTGLKLLSNNILSKVYPPPVSPGSVVHSYVMIKPGIKIHFVESGSGPAVILLHGFPDFWYGWRHQIPALANAGYRVIVPSQRGYGESSSPPNVEDFSQKELCGDVITIMDKLGIDLATVVGHDWGGSLAWALALKYSDRFRGVCGVNTPFFRINPTRNPLVSMYKNPGVFDYQLYFQDPGVAEKELNEDVERTLCTFLQGYSEKVKDRLKMNIANTREHGGILVGLPKKVHRSNFITAFDISYYVSALSRNGFRGPLNWYRNYTNNWKWLRPIAHRKISMPALMVTASNDPVLRPKYTIGMEEYVINLQRLQIDNCGHWTAQERPHELNEGLISWLDNIHTGNILSKL